MQCYNPSLYYYAAPHPPTPYVPPVSPHEMNQAALKALQQGDNMQAIEILRKALGDLYANNHQNNRNNSGYCHPHGTMMDSTQRVGGGNLYPRGPKKRRASSSNNNSSSIKPAVVLETVALPPLSCESSLRSVLYNRAFCLPQQQQQSSRQAAITPAAYYSQHPHHHYTTHQHPTRKEEESTSSMDLDGTSCLLFFNIALALHRQGITTGSSDTLQKALFIYQEALALLERSSAKKPCYVVVLAALHHNLAALYGDFYLTEQSRENREALAKVFEWEGSLQMGPVDFQFFHVGLWLSRGEDFRLAPAA